MDEAPEIRPTVVRTIAGRWLELEPIRLGRIPMGHGTPDCYVTCETEETGPIRVDLFRGNEECYSFTEASIWSNALLIGWGNRVYHIDLRSRLANVIDLGSYFGHFYISEDFALAASAERLSRINKTGGMEWKSEPLGIDGVVVNRVEHGLIEGEGEWNPPGGWRPFRVRLESGQSEM